MSEAITFQVAVDSASSRFSQPTCSAPRMRPPGVSVGSMSATVRPAIGAQVEEEDVEHRPIGDLAIDPARLGRQ